MTVPTTKTARPFVALAAAAATSLALTACASEPVVLPADRLEAALLAAGEAPVGDSAVIDVMTEEDAPVTSDYMSLTEAELEGAEDSCRAAFDEVYPEEGLMANTAAGNYGAPDEYTMTIVLSSFHQQLEFSPGDRYQEIGEACEGQTLMDDAGVGIVFDRLESDGAQGFRMRPADIPGVEEDLSVFEAVVLVEERGNNVIEVIGMGMSEQQAVDVLNAQSEKLAGEIADA